MKRIIVSVLALAVLALPILHNGTALAASSDNPIQDGLWRGYNLIFGGTPTQSTPPKPAPATNKVYAALGDSVAAGLGLPVVSSPTSLDATCGRSSQAYPNLVAKSISLPLVSAACSGAKAGDIITKQAVTGPNIPAQLDTIYAAGKPQLFTITAGANDAHWRNLIMACYAYDCDNAGYTAVSDAYLAALRAKLYLVFETINQKSNGTPPTTIVTGYYDPLSDKCSALQSNVTPAELSWVATETAKLNQTIQDVTSHYSFVLYAPVDFSGHDICSSDSWVQGLSAAAPLHPTAKGQRVIAQSVLAAYRQ